MPLPPLLCEGKDLRVGKVLLPTSSVAQVVKPRGYKGLRYMIPQEKNVLKELIIILL